MEITCYKPFRNSCKSLRHTSLNLKEFSFLSHVSL